MANSRHDIRNSSPVEEIIGKTPSSLVRWGISLIALVFIITIAGAWFIRYPYIISGKVIISTENPPASIMAQLAGRIEKLYVSEGQDVEENEILGVLESSADLESVIRLDKFINNKDPYALLETGNQFNAGLPESDNLGELQTSYSSFRSAYSSYLNYIEVDYYGRKISALLNEIKGIEQLIVQLGRKKSLLKEKVDLAGAEFKRDSLVYSSDFLSDQEFEDSKKLLVEDKINLEQVGVEISLKKIDKISLLKELEEYRASSEKERREVFTKVEEESLRLAGELKLWYRLHLLTSPISGKATFSKFWGENQSVNKGDIVITVIPKGEQEIIARSEINMRGSGRVNPGRKVMIKLSGYPYLQYGLVEGLVKSVSLAANNEIYIVDIELPDGLLTTMGEELDFSQNMSGQAEIITDRLRLIERLIEPVAYLIERNRFIAD